MKVSINSKFLEGPYGGGMQFANYMRDFLIKNGHSVVNDLNENNIDVILHVNPFPELTPEASGYSYLEARRYKNKHPETVIIERVNECDERKGTHHMNKLLVKAAEKSDFVVFIASWLRPLMLKAGLSLNKPGKVILNGADQEIFNTKNKAFWDGAEKLKIVTHHWSNNLKKGHSTYQKLDELLDQKDLGEIFEFTYIGRLPKDTSYRNTKILPPLSGQELADELKKHHIYITASENEPGGMHHIEGALSGLPILYINSGALREYCEGFGLEFNENNLAEKLLEIRGEYAELIEKIKSYNNTAERMAGEYLKLFEELYSKREDFVIKNHGFNIKKFVPKFLKYPLMAIYVSLRCLLRGFPSKKIEVNLAGVLPPVNSKKIVHGGKVKLLALRERFGDTWKKFNVAYFVSSGLPFAPAIWVKIYKIFGVKVIWNQNGVAYRALYPKDTVERINSLLNPIHQADYVIFQSVFTKKCSDKFLGPYSGPSTILVNPVDTKLFKPRAKTLWVEPLLIIMSGHHFESKERLRVSLDAIRELREQKLDVKLIIIGNTQEVPSEDWIEVLGKFTRGEAPELYQRAHILLHLKSLDPCPNIVLEALSAGLPVVGLDNGGMPELVSEGAGVLIKAPEDFDSFHYPTPSEVAKAVMKVRENLQVFSENARNQALKFDKEIWLKKHEEIFKSLLK